MASKAVNKKMRRKAKRKSAGRRKRTSDGGRRRWSQQVTEQSDALTLDKGVFTQRDPKRIAASLKRSALRSTRRKAEPYRSALSMLTFYIKSRGQEPACEPQEDLDAGEGRAPKAVRQGLISPSHSDCIQLRTRRPGSQKRGPIIAARRG